MQSVVRRAEEKDLPALTEINLACFSGNQGGPDSARQWMECRLNSFPLYQVFVLEVDGEVVGYIGWEIHGGFQRPLPVVELEQIGLMPSFQDKGLGGILQNDSMAAVAEWVRDNNKRIESQINFIVWVYSGNLRAIASYMKIFSDGVVGMRTQYGGRSEVMLRHQLSHVVDVPREER
ncbi:MAG: GNAT family N-acetyltransferase [Patescibacteria group bacterium]